MNLIDKDALVAEIKSRISDIKVTQKAGMIKKRDANKKILLFKSVLSLVDTLEVKEVDLEKEFYDFLDTLIGKDNGHLSDDELFRIAEYFYELGLKAQKGE